MSVTVPSAADIAAFLKACPRFVEEIYADGYEPDPQISNEEFAAEWQKIVDVRGSDEDGRLFVPAKKTRRRGQPKREAAKQAIAVLYPNGIPIPASLPNVKLCDAVREHLLKHLQITSISDDSILREAGRK